MSGAGLFKLNLRFPGQYYDSETGLHYNYYRTYEASIGRYLQSDPSGLAGGINTFAYADGSPLAKLDFFGLQARGPDICVANCPPPMFKAYQKCYQSCFDDNVKNAKKCAGLKGPAKLICLAPFIAQRILCTQGCDAKWPECKKYVDELG